MILSYVIVVFVGVVTVLLATTLLAPGFVDDHVAAMEQIADPGAERAAVSELRSEILMGFSQALFIAATISTLTALIVGILASNRLLRPIESIRLATRRLASGAYAERVELPPEAELAALATDVNALARTLEETEQRRMRLISEVAHELRTPLATIKGYMEGLVDGVFQPTDEIFLATGREAARLERLATDLSKLSRIQEETALDLRFELIDLGAVAIEVAESLRPRFDEKGVTLHIADLPTLRVRVDPDRMAQVFTNIIDNAVTYTPELGAVNITGYTNGGLAAISIADTGRGLESQQLDKVFDRFYRADRSTPGGTGIGLTIAHGIVRAHRGSIEVTSPGTGRGSTFTVVIPLATA